MTAPPPRIAHPVTGEPADPRVEALVNEVIGRVADKWTMLILEVLAEHGETRFTRVGELVGNISQKMLTQTLRQIERDGLVVRTVHPVIPPKVEYRLTDLGVTLAEAFCSVWTWAETNLDRIEAARAAFDAGRGKGGGGGGAVPGTARERTF
jgi:DNA-binding HxlR family transcriptional regulator